jgi:hypothetical protein
MFICQSACCAINLINKSFRFSLRDIDKQLISQGKHKSRSLGCFFLLRSHLDMDANTESVSPSVHEIVIKNNYFAWDVFEEEKRVLQDCNTIELRGAQELEANLRVVGIVLRD